MNTDSVPVTDCVKLFHGERSLWLVPVHSSLCQCCYYMCWLDWQADSIPVIHKQEPMCVHFVCRKSQVSFLCAATLKMHECAKMTSFMASVMYV